MIEGWKKVALMLVFLAVIVEVSSRRKVKNRFRKHSISADQKNKLDYASCLFDNFNIPCQWSNEIPQSMINQSFSLKGKTDVYSWFAYSYWFHKAEVDLDNYRYNVFHMYNGNLLLVVYTSFRRLSDKVRFSNLKDSSLSAKKSDSLSPTEEDKIKISSRFSVSKFEYTSRVARSEIAMSYSPIEVPFREYHSPALEIEKEGCVSFRFRGNSHLSSSDFLNLWSHEENSQDAHLLWSSYGPVSKIWRSYSIGLFSGRYVLSFNGSMFIQSRVSRIVFAYEIDNLVVSNAPCCDHCNQNKMMSIAAGLMQFPLSEFTEKTCKWISFTFQNEPIVKVSAKVQNVNTTVHVTHASKTGINVCINRKNGSGSNIATINWVAVPETKKNLKNISETTENTAQSPQALDVNEEITESQKYTDADGEIAKSQKAVDTTMRIKVPVREESDKVFELPSLPNEKNYGPKSLGKSILERLFSSRICGPDQFECDLECIPLNRRCDGKRDCIKGEDELGCRDRFGFLLFSALSVVFVLSLFIMAAHYTCVDQGKQSPGDKLKLLSSGTLKVSDVSSRGYGASKSFVKETGSKPEVRQIATVD